MMSFQEVQRLDRLATEVGYRVTDYRKKCYLDGESLRYCYFLIIDIGTNGEIDEVSVASAANFEMRRFDRIFD